MQVERMNTEDLLRYADRSNPQIKALCEALEFASTEVDIRANHEKGRDELIARLAREIRTLRRQLDKADRPRPGTAIVLLTLGAVSGASVLAFLGVLPC